MTGKFYVINLVRLHVPTDTIKKQNKRIKYVAGIQKRLYL